MLVEQVSAIWREVWQTEHLFQVVHFIVDGVALIEHNGGKVPEEDHQLLPAHLLLHLL
jgi:hypothetical protein